MKAIIAAGGSGTRLQPLTFSTNKQLLKVLNKPMLLYPFEAILDLGIKEVAFIVNETRPAIENLIGDGSRFGIHVEYINQTKPLGLAHVVKISEEFINGDSFVYMLGDNIFTHGLQKPFNRFVETKADGLLTILKHKENRRMGVPVFDDNGKLIQVIEKPENPPNEYAIPGLYMFSANVFHAFSGDDAIKPSPRGELEITDLYNYLLQHNYKVEAEEMSGKWLDPGKFDDMISAHHYLLDHMQENGNQADVDGDSVITGSIVAKPGTVIRQSRIVGPVNIAENTVITNCTIGPYVTIGANCSISNTVIANSVIYDHTVIEKISKAVIDSLIGQKTHLWDAGHESVSFFIGDHCDVRLG